MSLKFYASFSHFDFSLYHLYGWLVESGVHESLALGIELAPFSQWDLCGANLGLLSASIGYSLSQ